MYEIENSKYIKIIKKQVFNDLKRKTHIWAQNYFWKEKDKNWRKTQKGLIFIKTLFLVYFLIFA